MNDTHTGGDFEQRLSRIEGLLATLSKSTEPQLGHAAREVVTTVLELHQRGLARMLELVASNEQLREALVHDARVSPLLLLHGLHPWALDARVSRAVEGLRDRFRDKLLDVTVEAQAQVVTVRVTPAANACGSTRAALKAGFEDALLAVAPDADAVSVELTEPAPALITLRIRRPALQERSENQR